MSSPHEHDEKPDWGWWWPVNETAAVRQCLSDVCQVTEEAEYSRCQTCKQMIVEMPSDYGSGHTEWIPYGDLDNNDPCADDNGLPAPHTPALRSV